MRWVYPDKRAHQGFQVKTFNDLWAGTQCWNNVDPTLIQRQDIESTLFQRCFPAWLVLDFAVLPRTKACVGYCKGIGSSPVMTKVLEFACLHTSLFTRIKILYLIKYNKESVTNTFTLYQISITENQIRRCIPFNPFIPEFLKWTLLFLNLNLFTDENRRFSLRSKT